MISYIIELYQAYPYAIISVSAHTNTLIVDGIVETRCLSSNNSLTWNYTKPICKSVIQ